MKKKFAILIGVLAVAALFAGRHVIVQEIKTKATIEIGKKIFEGQLGKTVNIGGADIDVSSIADHFEEQDVKQATEIAEKYISPENIQQAAALVASGDTEGLQALAEGRLKTAPLVTHTLEPEGLLRGLELMRDKTEPYCKVIWEGGAS